MFARAHWTVSKPCSSSARRASGVHDAVVVTKKSAMPSTFVTPGTARSASCPNAASAVAVMPDAAAASQSTPFIRESSAADSAPRTSASQGSARLG